MQLFAKIVDWCTAGQVNTSYKQNSSTSFKPEEELSRPYSINETVASKLRRRKLWLNGSPKHNKHYFRAAFKIFVRFQAPVNSNHKPHATCPSPVLSVSIKNIRFELLRKHFWRYELNTDFHSRNAWNVPLVKLSSGTVNRSFC